MSRLVTVEEVRKVMFYIGFDKAPGPDGYSAALFKRNWAIVGPNVTEAVISFFTSGKLLKA